MKALNQMPKSPLHARCNDSLETARDTAASTTSPYIKAFIIVVCVNVVLMCAFMAKNDTATYSFLHDYPTYTAPDGSKLYSNRSTFSDYLTSVLNAKRRGRNGEYNSIYPPLVEMSYSLIAKLSIPSRTKGWTQLFYQTVTTAPLITFVLLESLTLLVSSAFLEGLLRNMKTRARWMVVICTLMLLPVVYGLERGNSILICLTALLAFFYFFEREDSARCRLCAALCLSIAINIKIYPAVFLLCYLISKRHQEFWLTIGLSAAFFVLPLFYFKGFETFRELVQALASTSAAQTSRGFGRSVGLVGSLSILHGLVVGSFRESVPHWIALIFLAVTFLPTAVLTLRGESAGRTPPWQTACLLGTLAILAPGFSFTYNGVFLIPGLILFLRDAQKSGRNTLLLVLMLAALLPIPWGTANLFPALNVDVMDYCAMTTGKYAFPVSLTGFVNSLAYIGVYTQLLIMTVRGNGRREVDPEH